MTTKMRIKFTTTLIVAINCGLIAGKAGGQNFVAFNPLPGSNPNTIDGNIGISAILGGASNTIGAGYSTIGGGTGNNIKNNGTPNGNHVICGGGDNVIEGPDAFKVIVGGYGNKATGFVSTVVGGSRNVASGERSTVPGGRDNTASGAQSFAGGRGAVASGTGSFCWNDGTMPLNTAGLNGQSVFSGAGGTYAFGQGVNANETAFYVGQQGLGRGAIIQGNGTGRALEVNQAGGGLIGVNLSSSGAASTLNVENTGGAQYVARFAGDVVVTGRLYTLNGAVGPYSANGESPANPKTDNSISVAHPAGAGHPDIDLGFVTSNEKRVVFEGSVTLDAKGEAMVELPGYTEGLCSKFVYHLTPVGEPAQLYVAEKVKDSKFKISGGFPDLEVSWSVSGLRTAAAAN